MFSIGDIPRCSTKQKNLSEPVPTFVEPRKRHSIHRRLFPRLELVRFVSSRTIREFFNLPGGRSFFLRFESLDRHNGHRVPLYRLHIYRELFVSRRSNSCLHKSSPRVYRWMTFKMEPLLMRVFSMQPPSIFFFFLFFISFFSLSLSLL